MAGSEIEADGCPSHVRRPYKTTGFIPKVPYFAPLPLRLRHPPPIAPASCARTATVDQLASVLQPLSSLRLSCSRCRACAHLLPNCLMELWGRSSITSRCLEGLIHRGLLYPLSAVQEWLIPGDEGEPAPLEGYVISFAIFHE